MCPSLWMWEFSQSSLGGLSHSTTKPARTTPYLHTPHLTSTLPTLHSTALLTLHYTTLHTTLHYTTFYITLHYTILHYTSLHSITPLHPTWPCRMWVEFQDRNCTEPRTRPGSQGPGQETSYNHLIPGNIIKRYKQISSCLHQQILNWLPCVCHPELG